MEEKDVAPNLSRICASESVNFTQAYCSSFRTDRGIVATLSGYPGQPTTSIMRYSNKIQKLPALPEVLRRQGYHTQALYPSDASFFNMSNYFLCAGHDRLVTEDDFPAKQRSAQWGVPDHIGFDWLLRDLQEKAKDKNGRYYTTYLTISSHTPFDVPYHRLDDVKLNGFAYTDSCFGDSIDRLRPTEAWENLLIVCTADHGFNYREIASPDFAHVPFFLMGGAVKETMALDVIVSQTDLPALILGQLGLPHDEFVFSRDVLADTYTDPCAFSTFNNGFTIFDTTGCTVFDNNAASAIYGDDERRINRGKAFLQTLYDDLAKR